MAPGLGDASEDGSGPADRLEGGARVTARVLGTVQDGGLPHLGCAKACCVAARQDPSLRRRVACLGLSVAPAGPCILVDATPDLPSQAAELRATAGLSAPPGRPVDAILLTHAHMGHYTGLVHLGREAAAADALPVHATPRMCAFLTANGPWRRLVEWGHIRLEPLEPGRRRSLAPGLEVEALSAPHRDEDSDTVGFVFHGPARSLLYLPDTDAWRRWDPPVTALIGRVGIALIDGTFFDGGEVTWRDPSEIPHPTISESMDLLGEAASSGGCRIFFTHLNHSNPALARGSEAAGEIVRRGFAVASEGMEIGL